MVDSALSHSHANKFHACLSLSAKNFTKVRKFCHTVTLFRLKMLTFAAAKEA